MGQDVLRVVIRMRKKSESKKRRLKKGKIKTKGEGRRKGMIRFHNIWKWIVTKEQIHEHAGWGHGNFSVITNYFLTYFY